MCPLFSERMALHKLFYIFEDPDINTNSLLFFDDFYKYFDEKNRKQNVRLRPSFVLRSLKSTKQIGGKVAVSVKEILRYCFITVMTMMLAKN